jgi:hypothetical protein
MNCELFRKKLTDAVAAGELELSEQLAAHVTACENCRIFYEGEARLFMGMENGLRGMVNLVVPPSLVPIVRRRLEESSPSRDWLLAAIPTAAVLGIAAIVAIPLLHDAAVPVRRTTPSVEAKLVGAAEVEPAVAVLPTLVAARPIAVEKSSVRFSEVRQPARQKESTSPEIMVDQSESRGLKYLASTVFREPEVGKALLNPMVLPSPVTEPIALGEIAPLEVSELGIEPLAAEDR